MKRTQTSNVGKKIKLANTLSLIIDFEASVTGADERAFCVPAIVLTVVFSGGTLVHIFKRDMIPARSKTIQWVRMVDEGCNLNEQIPISLSLEQWTHPHIRIRSHEGSSQASTSTRTLVPCWCRCARNLRCSVRTHCNLTKVQFLTISTNSMFGGTRTIQITPFPLARSVVSHSNMRQKLFLCSKRPELNLP